MADEPINPRVALIESNLTIARAKLAAAEQRQRDIETQVRGLEDALERELGRAEPEPTGPESSESSTET